VIDPVVVDGEVASSSAVRARVRHGNVRSAARLMGRPFSLTGAVRKGEGRGRQLGFPP
jgi:riboflavin kinase/FMN adenylyltransferase